MFGSQTINGHRVPITASNAYAAEICKWEANYTQFGPPGRPFEQRDYPMMLYKARRPVQGERAEFCKLKIDGFEVGNIVLEHVIAETEDHVPSQESMGFGLGGPLGAVERMVKLEKWMATAAAERADTDRKMSVKAQAEAAVHDERTIQHLEAIPETPIKRMQKREA